MTKNPFKTHPDSYEDWCKKSKFLGKDGLYEEWKPIVKDFEDTYIYKRDLIDYCNMMVRVLKRLKKSHQNEYFISQLCKEWIDEYRANSKSLNESDFVKPKYPINKADKDIILLLFYNGKSLIEDTKANDNKKKKSIPDYEKMYKYLQNQIRKEFITHRANKSNLITKTITVLSKDFKPIQVSEYLKQLSNGICSFDAQYISRKIKNLRYTSS